uniref:Uncharacterized protein n=1 Tax=Ananas comosus var. bracteatus TaxID=296719 RepID=A0A6V7QMN4_ANACO|nr:unnamed protein product [Ananas comosus var. bracteatus]
MAADFSSVHLLHLFVLIISTFSGFFPRLVESHPAIVDLQWHPATATWYGSPDGDGSDGGACGYGTLVDVQPMRARVGAVSPVLFKGGEGCGACYKVRCMDPSLCSRRAVTVIVTDECPGGYCAFGRTHFDLSGAAFGRMAVAGNGGRLRDRGEISVVYRRCGIEMRDILMQNALQVQRKKHSFSCERRLDKFWLSLLVEYEDDEGDIGSMHIQQSNSVEWLEMKHVWGATWCITAGPLTGPFSVKITTLSTQRTLTARDVIPRNWSPKATYTSRLNFT